MNLDTKQRARIWRCGLRSFLLSLVLFVMTFPADARKGPEPKDSVRGPKLTLASSPAFGFAPLSVRLVATLSGINPEDPNYCHASVTWIRLEPGPSPEKETRLSETPRCVHGQHEALVATTFSKSFELDRPGSYLYRISVAGKDGKEIRSNYVTIKVLRVP